MDSQDWIYDIAGHGNTLYAAKASGLFASNDNAVSWQSLMDENVTITTLLSTKDSLFAGSVGGTFKAKEEGWQAAPFRAPAPTLSKMVSRSKSNSKTLFAASLEDGVFRSTNSGQTWDAWNIGLFDHHVLSLEFLNNVLYAGTETGLYQSNNDACTWDVLELPGKHDAVLSLASHKNKLYVGTESQGLYVLDGGMWEKLELPAGAINQILFANTRIFTLLDSRVFVGQHEIAPVSFRHWQASREVSCLALTGSGLALGFSNGDIELEDIACITL